MEALDQSCYPDTKLLSYSKHYTITGPPVQPD